MEAAIIGAPLDLGAGERSLIRQLGLAVHTLSEVDRRGIEAVVGEALERTSRWSPWPSPGSCASRSSR